MAAKAARGFRAILLADGLRLAAKGGMLVLLTRFLLTPEEYGLLFLAIAVLGVLLLFGELGFAKSTARYLTEFREREPGQVPYVVRTGLAATLVTVTLVAVALVVGRGVVASVLGEPGLSALLLVGTGFIAARALAGFCATAFQGFNRIGWSAVVNSTESIAQPVAVVALVVLGFGVVGALAGYVVGSAVAALFGLVVLRRTLRDYRDGSPRQPGLVRRILAYSVPLTATKGANVLDRRVDAVLVGFFLTPVAVAYYTLAKQIADLVMAPAAALGFAVSPSYGEHQANDRLERASRIYETTFAHTIAAYAPAAAGMILVADPAVRIVFGDDYAGAVPVVQLFGFHVLLLAIDKITNDGLDFLGEARSRAIAKGVASVGNFVLNLALIPVFGVVGAAVATVTASAILVGVELVIVARQLPIRPVRMVRQVALSGGVTAAMAVVVFLALPFVSGLVTLVGIVLLGGAVWGVLATASGLLDVRRTVAALV